MRQVAKSGAWHERQAGLTLVELMISVLLAAMLSAGLFYLTSGQQRSYNSQVKSMALQESLWGAMEYLSRQVRHAGRGFGSCAGGELVGASKQPVFRGLRVFNSCELTTDLPARCGGGERSDSFAITMRDDQGLPQRALSEPSELGALEVDHPEGFVPGDLLFVWPFGHPQAPCYLRRLSKTTRSATKNHYRLITEPVGRGTEPLGLSVPAGTRVVSLGTTKAPSTMIPRYFSIDRSKGYPRLVTWQSSNATAPSTDFKRGSFEVVADGVEDLQIAWACDANGDGQLQQGQGADARVSDEWFANTPGDAAPTCKWRNPREVRITLIGRTRRAKRLEQRGFRPAAEDRSAGLARDDQALSGNSGTFTRRVLTATVRPENLLQPRLATP